MPYEISCLFLTQPVERIAQQRRGLRVRGLGSNSVDRAAGALFWKAQPDERFDDLFRRQRRALRLRRGILPGSLTWLRAVHPSEFVFEFQNCLLYTSDAADE